MAEIYPRVLLVSADLHRPTLHEVFGLPREPGLCDLLRSEKPVAELTAEELGCPTNLPGLFVLACGRVESTSVNLFYSPRLRALIERASTLYDAVLIDSPPLLMSADARVLSRLVEGVVLVLRSGVTDRTSAIAALQRLAEDGTRVLGTILNDWDPRSGGAEYYRRSYAREVMGK